MSGSNPPGTYTITLVPPLQSISPGIGRRGTGPFADWPREMLFKAKFEAEKVLVAVLTGDKPVTVSYAEGNGHRQVVYTRVDADQLRVLIRDLAAGLGRRSHGAVWPRFG